VIGEIGQDEAVALLQRVPLLQGLRPPHLAALAAGATIRHADVGQPLCTEGRPSPGLIVVQGGRAAGGGFDLSSGDWLGEWDALEVRMAERTVSALDAVDYLALSARALHDAVRADPELGVALLRELSRRHAAQPDTDGSEQMIRYATDLRESFRESERRQAALRNSVMGAVRALVTLAEAKHPWSRGHAARAARTARKLAREFGWSDDAIGHAAVGGLLHDVGYVVVDVSAIERNGSASEAERAQVHAHPEVGARIIGNIDFLDPVVPFVLCHHERFDGRGYPRGLTGHGIPVEGRLMAAVELLETYRATHPRIDRGVLGRMVRDEAGTQLDPEMAMPLAHLVASGALDDG
jgi:HD-GYP domain-containing protein (c-di-GMP phosphodiesterase class II)